MKTGQQQLIWFSMVCLMAGLLSCGQTVDLPADVQAVASRVPETVDYNLHIKPILSDRCFACHGPDQRKQKGGLRLDIAENAFATLESGHRAIVPGSLSDSELFHRIVSTDPEVMMPTPESHLSLSAEEKATLLRWIEQGAEYKEHWSLIAPAMPEVPKIAEQGWARNDIDRFVLAKLREKGLSPNPEADKPTLLRRVSLDLTGLPPTPIEVDAFLADTLPNAYEKVVNRLLNSPHYGEQMATNWLDIARYADTHGYQLDVMRTAWPYRDWVIRAFNRNLSYDRFITWQLAGDLLPTSTANRRDQIIATAFNRMHPQNQEGGIVEEEYLTEYAADRTATFGKAMLGLTVECARCHDHKYDPISQKDYYQLFAFFNTVNEAGQVPFHGESSPTLILTDRKADAQLRYIQTKIRAVQDSLRSPHPRPLFLGARGVYPDGLHPSPLGRGDGGEGKGPIARYTFDDTARYRFANVANAFLPATVTGNTDLPPTIGPGRFGRGRLVNGEGNIDLGPKVGFFDRYDPFSVGLWIKLLKTTAKGPIFSRSNGLDNGDRGYELKRHADGTLGFNLSHTYPDNAIDLHTVKPVSVGQWLHIAVTYDGSGSAAGTHMYLNGQLVPTRIYADNLKRSMLYGPGHTNGFGLKLNFLVGSKFRDSMADFWVDELNLFDRAISPIEVRALIRNQLPPLPTSWNVVDSVVLCRQQELCELRRAETYVYDAQSEVMIMHERPYVRPTHLLKRGAYDAPGEVVHPNTLTALGSLPDELPKNRLGLAQWLMRSDNPLFARVVVNRFWQQLFGQGLVKSSDDFGNQGTLPSHPELLDYLAVTFREGSGKPGSCWNVKTLLRDMVLSATYRQSSRVSLKKRESDPDNTWLARGTSYRLSAEQVRDNALAVAGLLNRRVGGASVHPYQPGGIWEMLNQGTHYRQSQGDSLYRRSMYTIWKRTAPPPMMLNFDAAERHLCTVRRQKTSTPLQALVTLNDPQFVEAARVLAQKKLSERKKAEGEELVRAFIQTVLSRPARPVEVDLLKKLYDDELLSFNREPKRAIALLTVGNYPAVTTLNASELAAWTVVVSTIMNMDEALVKR